MQNRFQVDLRGLIELLSRHLYSGPAVYVRELLQNSVDAIAARRQLDPDFVGSVQIELMQPESGPATLLFQDDGVGLTEEEIHQFLSTIGQSSKRGASVARPEDFLGQFGIGLLSCFMVTDEIVVLTRSAKPTDAGEHPGVEWRGNSDGTYSVRVLDNPVPIGTQVYLRAKDDAGDFMSPRRVLELARHFGRYLQPQITFAAGGKTDTVNDDPPWEEDTNDPAVRERLLEYGKSIFERNFLDVIPLKSQAGKVAGLAYVLADPVHGGAEQVHRVYLKNMLLSATAHDLLPKWGFFAQCIINAQGLRPTASREAFYEDELLDDTRLELGQCLRTYLVNLAQNQPGRFEHLLNVHHLAVKALAIEDDDCLELFADWLPFETSLGRMTLGEFRRENPIVRYVPTRDQFRQIAPVAASESLAIVNAGYVYDVEVLRRIAMVRNDIDVQLFEADQLSDRFEALSDAEREATVLFERTADATLQRFKCTVEISKFHPPELPALYITNNNASFLRSVEQSQEVADDLWSNVLGDIAGEVTSVYARLHLNYLNPLVQRIQSLEDRQGQRRCIEMLYIQALLMGHFPLKQQEIGLLNQGLLGLIDWAVSSRQGES